MDASRPVPDADGALRLGATASPSLAELAAAVDALVLPIDVDVLAGALLIQDRLSAKTSQLLDRVRMAELHEDDGAPSMRGWLQDRARMTRRAAIASSNRARRLRGCPITTAAWLASDLSGGQVDAIVTNLSDRVAALWAEQEAELVPLLSGLSTAETVTAMQAWRAKADAIIDGDKPPSERPNELVNPRTLDNRSALSGNFDPFAASIIDRALDEEMVRTRDGEDPVPIRERRADALTRICEHYLDTHAAKASRRNRPHLALSTTLDDLCDEAHGEPGWFTDTNVGASNSILRFLACDANVHLVIRNHHGAVLDYGRETRTISPDLFAALAERDGGCRAPGCDAPPEDCEAHHIVHWADGGETSLANTVLGCRYTGGHHHLWHKKGWHLELDPETAILTLTPPNGRLPVSTRPRPRPGSSPLGG